MKIAQIAPLIESVPPRLYGGTERIVSYLTDELVRLGHDVTLFASADSVTSAKLVGCVPTALRLDPNVHDPIPYYMLMLDRVYDQADEFGCVKASFGLTEQQCQHALLRAGKQRVGQAGLERR